MSIDEANLTETEVLEQLRPMICEVTGARPAEVRMEAVLMGDLGAESLDLLDLCFLIEERFGITIEPNEFENRSKKRLAGSPYDQDGVLTEEALQQLRVALPEVGAGKLTTGLRKTELPLLLTVGVFVHLIQRKLAEAPRPLTLTLSPGVPGEWGPEGAPPSSSLSPVLRGEGRGEGSPSHTTAVPPVSHNNPQKESAIVDSEE